MGFLPQPWPERRGPFAVVVCWAIAALGVAFLSIADLGSRYVHSINVPAAVVVTAIVAAGGMALSTVIRLLSGSAASFEQWVRRSSAGTLLLTPAALILTRTFLGDGWDFNDCGTLLTPYRPAAANLANFRAACDTAAGDRITRLLAWAAVGCAVAVVYGLWLRYRRRNPRVTLDE